MHYFGIVNRVLNPVQQRLTVEYDPRADYRFSRCFLDSATQTSKEFKSECAEQALLGRRNILLWGDSLSAQLYPGLNALREKHSFAITQRTASSCPPSVTARYHERGNCDEINSSTVEYIKGKSFDTALLNGRWGNDAESQIRDLVSFLRMQGIYNIYIWPYS
ncbi:SGNH hydrolase domain-containing protein [Chromobacterium vaccinii]|uniref:SGNH hydrolase domain-containing protein n=1 Tax=Chromobacterium vaccinii TaxID=1108595 RepID=UPI0036F3EB7E